MNARRVVHARPKLHPIRPLNNLFHPQLFASFLARNSWPVAVDQRTR